MSSPDPIRKAEACPVCGKPVAAAHAPFCSQGCRDRDLLQWLGEGYRVPGPRVETDEQE
ncbi:DNA gyrase inhibitor YacG [Sphingomonas sp. CGMCC 1.13654]|uniref:DNA gyrase inhibitor YacG n=1 Tax=Sphingomonas chungangi TaxID=2683589 RepID=A0A838L9V6_9SPHN|nr:DNA gyrase inhibitor YacG [Sphingomonas chungangi]MBA2935349.1 DNA gyrase inhibitor YacG [Sphingomonas chungangi]